MKTNHTLILLLASVLVMTGLVFLQFRWMEHARKLEEEIFEQRASMALCSTLEDYGEGATCSQVACSLLCTPGTAQSDTLPAEDLLQNHGFHSDLKRTLAFYNIDLDYNLSQTCIEPKAATMDGGPMCIVNIPPHSDQQESFVTLTFPNKQQYMNGKLKYMIGTSLLILLFSALVLWFANWWLLRQKKLLRLNMEMYNHMAHEFRTPLTNIQLASGMLSNQMTSSGSQKFVEIIRNENSRLIQQVERVLHLARLDTTDYTLQKESFKVQDIIHSVQEDLAIQIEEKQATLNIHALPLNYEIYGDRQHLINAFRNLIDNALKHSGPKPEITFSAQEQNEGIILSVEDNGKGISPDQSRQIFKKFQQLPEECATGRKGFGLGLAYVKRIVELHKGFIQLNSALGKGSRFDVYLPKLS